MRRRKRQYHHPYETYYGYRPQSFGARLGRFFARLLTTIITIASVLIGSGLLVLAYVYRAYLWYVAFALIGVAALVLLLFFLKFLIWAISSMSHMISAMRMKSIAASKAKVELRVKQEEYKQRIAPRRQPLQVPEHQAVQEQPQSDVAPVMSLRQEKRVQGMPERRVVYYRDVQRFLKPGQLVALVRGDDALRLEPWTAFKSLLVLGSSSSGKTSTMIEKILGFTSDGRGRIVPCDPHATKEESLFNRIYPLERALFPGACLAVGHQAILENIRLIKQELERRVNGADCSVPVLLVVEELNRLLDDELIAKEIAQILRALGREGRGFNVYLMAGCQEVTGISKIRKAFISYIVHRSDESEARLLIPYRYAKYASELAQGQCFVKDNDGVTEAGLQVYVTLQDIERVASRLPQRRVAVTPPSRTASPSNGHQAQPPMQVPMREYSEQSRATKPVAQEQPVKHPRPVQRTRPTSVQRSTEDLQQVRRVRSPQNPKHTWVPESGDAIEELFDAPDTVLVPDPLQPVRTEELKPDFPSLPTTVGEKAALLAQMRARRKTQKLD